MLAQLLLIHLCHLIAFVLFLKQCPLQIVHCHLDLIELSFFALDLLHLQLLRLLQAQYAAPCLLKLRLLFHHPL